MKISALLGLAGLATLSQGQRTPRDYANNDYYVLHLDRSTPPEDIARRLALAHEGELTGLEHHHVFRAPKNANDDDIVKREIQDRKRRKRDVGGSDPLDGVLLAAKQRARQRLHKRGTIPPPPAGFAPQRRDEEPAPNEALVKTQSDLMKELEISDPIFKEQWHLLNTVYPGHDVNVTGLWREGITGHNVTVAIVDDGLDMTSEDLKPNYFAEGSWDFNDHDESPHPELSDDHHGTRCAGEVAAARNDVCGVGVAYTSKVAGIRILSKPISDADEAEAMMYKIQDNDIYSCSWGPPDDGRSMEAPDVLIRRAMLKAIQKGRGGLGSIYVFASGNGAANGDNCNFDGYTNSIYSITIGAVDHAGKHPYYSELCSAQLVVTYSSGSRESIHTTDTGKDSCYKGHGGTSAAAPLAAGIFSMVLEVRPDLTWRDLQYLALDTAVPIDDGVAEWQDTKIGKKFSHTFGYGKIDSYAIVHKAKDWEKVKPQAWYFSPWVHVKKDIPQGKDGISVELEVTEAMVKAANLERLEHVTVTMNVEHKRRGDLSVDLISPEGIVSHIATARELDEFEGGYKDWTFMSVVHWGESGVGKWKVIVKDTLNNDKQGKFIDFRIKLWGEAIDADKAKLLPMPDQHDDDDHDKVQSTTLPAETVSLGDHPKPTTGTNPTDHPHRPTKPKPSASGASAPTGTEEAAQEATTSPASSWVEWLPSFGASKKAKAWIYGAIGLIAVFCCGLGVYFWAARRRRIRNDPRNTYEFELIDEAETEGLNGEKGATGAGGRRARRTRGGELYDAFAEGSDEEEPFEDYRDQQPRGHQGHHRVSSDGADQYVVGDESDDDDEGHRGESAPLGGRR